METMTKDEQKQYIKKQLKQMLYSELVDLSIKISTNWNGIGNLTAKEYLNLVTYAKKNHKQCPYDKTGTWKSV